MAAEARRACGYRKVGGLYLCSDGPSAPCCKMPIVLHVCPTCNGGVKQTRGWQWLDPLPWVTQRNGEPLRCKEKPAFAMRCPLAHPEMLGKRVGLIWVGEAFYPTPQHFTAEAVAMGISRRIQAVPRGFKIGETWVFLAHPKVSQIVNEDGKTQWVGGVFQIMRPTRIEKIVTEDELANEDEMKKLADAGITPVAVPSGDRDHQGSVYERDPETLLV